MGEDTTPDAAKPVAMRFSVLRCSSVAAALLALGLAACQGNVGSPTGLSIPQTQSFSQPGAPGQGGSGSRERALEGAVYVTASTSEIPLPSVGGFAVSIRLGTPGPSSTPSPSASPTTSPTAKSRNSRSASPSPSSSPSPSLSPSPSPSPSVSPLASGKPTPSPKPTPKPKIVTKTTIYPEDAPPAPTPQPSGDVETFFKRVPIVRGFLQPAVNVSLYGLGAVRFTIPDAEQTTDRGFTIAFFETGKKHHDRLMAYDSSPTLADDVVASSLSTTPIPMKKGESYFVVLYGDEGPSTPSPVVSNYPQPGTNPFVTPYPQGYPPQGQGYPQGQQPGAPYPTQTPFGVYPTQIPH